MSKPKTKTEELNTDSIMYHFEWLSSVNESVVKDENTRTLIRVLILQMINSTNWIMKVLVDETKERRKERNHDRESAKGVVLK